MRAGIRAMLQGAPGLLVVGDLSDALQVPNFLQKCEVDLILMDIRMPGIDGLEATRRIRKDYPPRALRVIVLTTFDQDEVVLTALRAGANGFLNQDALYDNWDFAWSHSFHPNTASKCLDQHVTEPFTAGTQQESVGLPQERQ